MHKLIYLLVLMIVLAACGGSPTPEASTTTGDGPDVVARNWLTALIGGDMQAAAALTCAERRADLESAPSAEVPGEIDFTGVTFTVSDQTDTSATVTASGNLSITVSGQTVEQAIDATGMTPTMQLVREDNAWRVCS